MIEIYWIEFYNVASPAPPITATTSCLPPTTAGTATSNTGPLQCYDPGGLAASTQPPFGAYDNMLVTWSDDGNKMGTDFSIYSSFDDALQGRNPWTYCDYDVPNVGFPHNCGPAKAAAAQWTSLSRAGGQTSVRFSVYAPDGKPRHACPRLPSSALVSDVYIAG